MIAAPPPSQSLAERLLAATHDRERRALIDAAGPDPRERHDAVLALVAEAERVMGADVRRMERLCLDALALAERADDDYLRAMATMRHGDYFRVAGRNAEARDRYDAAAAIFTRLDRPVEAARTRIGWVWATAKLGHPDEALAAATRARRALILHGEHFRAAVLDGSIALLHKERGDHRAALRANTRALAAFRSMDRIDPQHVGRAHAGRALALTRVGRYDEAFREYRTAQAILQRSGQVLSAARATRNTGEAEMEIGRYAAALRSFEAALSVFRSAALHGEAAQVTTALMDCYLNLNRPKEALVALDEAEDDLRRTDGVQVAFAVALRGVAAHLMLGDRTRALALLEETERRFPAGASHHRAWLAEQRATLHLRDGDAPDALLAARRAAALARAAGSHRREAAALLAEGGALLALGEVDQATRTALRAGRLARDVDAAPLLARSHELLGRIAEAQRRSATARRRYARAIEQLEREQGGVIFEFRDSFAAERGTAYERLASLQMEAGRPRDALRTAERAKSRALADAVAGVVELRPRGSLEARRLGRALDRARGEYAAIAADAMQQQPASDESVERTRRRLAEQERRVSDLVRRLQLAGADGDRTVLDAAAATPLPSVPPDTVVVEYFRCGDDILRFWVDETGVTADRLVGAQREADRLLAAFRLNIETVARFPAGSGGHDGLVAQARTILMRLYGRLLDGFGDRAACRTLVVVPHGRLHYLPFHAFHDGDRYLVERVSVCFAPSAALYGVCRERSSRPRPAGSLVLAHTAGGQLPHTAIEAEAVAAVLGTTAHAENVATRTLVERAGRRAGVIHIAAHGEFRADAPLFSSVSLADGPLTTADVYALDLRAGLVTLSGCETGRSVVGGGDELAGLARAFLSAGAAGLLVSQWRVEDASTAVLMRAFYERFVAGESSAAALRGAQLQAIGGLRGEAFAHPFFWAGFQVIGGC